VPAVAGDHAAVRDGSGVDDREDRVALVVTTESDLIRADDFRLSGRSYLYNARGKGDRMRFMVIVKGAEDYEAGAMPSAAELAAMGKFNQELADAGAMLAGEGLHPSSKGVRINYGFWLIQVGSKDEAVEWLKRAPFREGDVEIRQVFENDDFGGELTPELRQQEQRIREQVEQQQS
jgi:hypothetical protein